MVGLVQEEIRRQQERTMDQKQRIHHDFTVVKHSALHISCLLRYILHRDSHVDFPEHLSDLFLHQSDGYTICLLVQEHI